MRPPESWEPTGGPGPPEESAQSSPGRYSRALADNPELVPGLLATSVFVAWAASEGGFAPTSSNPGGLFLLALGVVTGFAYRRRLRELPRASLFAAGLVTAFAAWTFFSIDWADVKGVAWDGANRTLLYAGVVGLFLIPAWRPRNGAIVMGAFAVGIAGVGVGYFLHAAGAANPVLSFVDDRFSEPTGYHNATAALFLEAMFPALFLAGRREMPWPARGLLLGTAGVLVELALLPQSRGSEIVFPIVALLYLIVIPDRLRSLIVTVPLAAATALSAGSLLDVYSTTRAGGDVSAALHSARTAIVLSFLALLVAGCAIGLLDRSLRISERGARLTARAVGGVAAVAALVGAVLLIGVVGNPVTWGDHRWQDFKSGQAESQTLSEGRFGASLGSNRYDFWRVAVSQFERDPLQGAGVDNFAVDYLRERHSGEEPLHPHSLPLGILSQTGLVGAALFVAFLSLLILAATRARTGGPEGLGRGLAGVALVVSAYWFLHSSGDWFWALPAVSAPPLAWLAMAGRLRDGSDRQPEARTQADQVRAPPVARRIALAGAGLLVGTFAAGSYVLPWAAARDVDEATRIWTYDPAAAFDRLERARELNFLSEEPDLVAGAIAARIGDRSRMRSAFERALERDQFSWYALLELGALDALTGRHAHARLELRRASRLSPADPTIRFVQQRVDRGRSVPLAEIRRQLLDRVCKRIGPSQEQPSCHR